MPWNGTGVFSRIYSWVADKAAGIDISSTRMDTDTDDIVTSGLGNCITRDGQGQPTANLPMANFRHTNVANAVNASDYSTYGQVQAGLVNWISAGGSSDALSAAYAPAVGAVADGQMFFLRAAAANTTTTPTFSPNGLGPYTITKLGGQAVAAGDIFGPLAEIILRYNQAHTRMELLNPGNASILNALIPTGTLIPYTAGPSVPAGFLFANGQAVSRTGQAALYGVCGTTFGAGDGVTSFNVPDLQGRVPAGVDNGVNRLPGLGLGGTEGTATASLITSNLPAYTPSGAVANGAITTTVTPNAPVWGNTGGAVVPNSAPAIALASGVAFTGGSTQASSTFSGNPQGGTSAAFAIVQPTIGIEWLIKT